MGKHRLAEQVGSFVFYAIVELEVESGVVDADPAVVVQFSDLENPCPGIDWRSATSFGIMYAASKLRRSLMGQGIIVKVTAIQGMVVDTGYPDLAYAAAFALWDAFGHVSAAPPRLNAESKGIEFPK